MKKFQSFRVCVVVAGACAAPLSHALEWDIGDFGISLRNRVTVGASWRVEDRDPQLIGKSNLNPDLCAADNCISFDGNPEPNQRLVDAPGGFLAQLMDDGNLNYDKGDMVAAVGRLATDLNVSWGDYGFKAGILAFYDPVNTDFDQFHPNTTNQAASSKRPGVAEDVVGTNIELMDLALSGFWFVGERGISASIGQQKLRWGEANLVPINSLNEINPLDPRRLHQPGWQISELFQPVPLVVISGDVFPDLGITAEAFYQLKWKSVQADPAGSFFGPIDILHDDPSSVTMSLGWFPEDPDDIDHTALRSDFAALLTNTSATAPVRGADDPASDARDDGQFGLRVNWFAENINGGTEFSFYGVKYHSRIPNISLIAAQRSCTRDAPNGTLAELVAACNLFNGSLAPGGPGSAPEDDPLPFDTIEALIEYPEDVLAFGISWSTNAFGWNFGGEMSFRPNAPLQVSAIDLLFAAAQPAFPDEEIVIGGDALVPGAGAADPLLAPLLAPVSQALFNTGLPIIVPGRRQAAPDIIETIYRGNPDVQGGQYIQGWVDHKVAQLVLNALQVFGQSSLFSKLTGSEQTIVLLEAGVTWIPDLLEPMELFLDGGSPNATHVMPGADGTGTPDGQPDSRRVLNPTQQTEALVTEVAFGWRGVVQMEYNDVWFGLTLKPTFILLNDISGYSPFPAQNFVEDRLQVIAGTEILYGNNWTGRILFDTHHGNRHYPLRDRDNISIDLSYTF